MRGRRVCTDEMRVLLVTDDDDFSATIKHGLHGVEALSVTQESVWLAIRAGLDVTKGMGTVLIDSTVGGMLQLRLYERLRPPDVHAHVPIVFTRAGFAGQNGPAHELDFYQPPDTTADDAVRLVSHVLGLPPALPPRVAARLGTPMDDAVLKRGQRTPPPAALPPGMLQRLGLWGVAAALVGFTFWPLVASTPLRQMFQSPFVSAASSGTSAVQIPTR